MRRQWLDAKRLAYSRLRGAAKRASEAASRGVEGRDELSSAYGEVREAFIEVELLAPKRVVDDAWLLSIMVYTASLGLNREPPQTEVNGNSLSSQIDKSNDRFLELARSDLGTQHAPDYGWRVLRFVPRRFRYRARRLLRRLDPERRKRRRSVEIARRRGPGNPLPPM